MDWVLQRVPEAFPLVEKDPKLLEYVQRKPGEYINMTVSAQLQKRGYKRFKKFHTSDWSRVYTCEKEDRRLICKIVNISPTCFFGASLYEIFVPHIVKQTIQPEEFFFVREKHITHLCLLYPRMHRDFEVFVKDMNHVAIMDVFLSVIDCVNGMHSSCLMHLDVKSPNFVFSHGRAWIIDHSLALLVGSQKAYDVTKVTSWYRPPELMNLCTNEALVAEYGRSVDVWSLGMTLWDFLMEKPLMQDSGVRDETQSDIDRYYLYLAQFLGDPPGKELKVKKVDKERYSWKCVKPLLRKKLSAEEIEAIIDAIWMCLKWEPKERPIAARVFEKLRPFGTLLLSPPMESVMPDDFGNYIDQHKTDEALFYKRFDDIVKTLNAFFEKFRFQNEEWALESFKDARVIGYSLWLRMNMSMETEGYRVGFDRKSLMFACSLLGIHMTRPHMLVEPTWFGYEKRSVETIIMTIVYFLKGRLII